MKINADKESRSSVGVNVTQKSSVINVSGDMGYRRKS